MTKPSKPRFGQARLATSPATFSVGSFLKSVGRSAGALSLATGAGKLATLVVLVLANRALTREDFGAYVLVLATSEIVRVAAAFGIDIVTLRALGRQSGPATEILSNAVVAKLLTAAASALLFVGAGWYLQFTPRMWVGAGFLLLDFFLSGAVLSFVTYHQSCVRADRAAPAILVAAGVNLLVGVFAFATHALMPVFLAALPAGNAVALLVIWLMSRRRVRLSFQAASRTAVRRFLITAWPLAAQGVAVLLYFRINTLLLSKLQGLAAVASYGAAYKITEAFLLWAAAVSGTTLPILARALQQGASREGIRVYRMSAVLAAGTAVPFGLFCTIFGRPLLIGLFGSRYATSASALALLGWAIVLMTVNMQTTNVLLALNRERLVLGLTLVNLGVNVVMNLALIPTMSINGAALATLTTEAINLLMQIGLIAILLRPVRWHQPVELDPSVVPRDLSL